MINGPAAFPAHSPVRVEALNMHELSWLEINLAALERNLGVLRGLLTGDRPYRPDALPPRDAARPLLCATVKKDAYGLGAPPIAHRLAKAGADMLAVYGPAEAEDLVKAAVTCPILLYMPLRRLSRTDLLYRHAVAEKLHLTIHDARQIADVNDIGQTFGIRMPVHLYLDTGMSRGGLSAEQFAQVLASMDAWPHVRIAGVYSHLASADADPDFAYEQQERFEQAVADHAQRLPRDVMLHIAASYAVLRDQRFHLDMVRPGLALFGYGQQTMQGPVIADAPQLEHTVAWRSRIVHVQRYKRRSPVGYGSTHKLKRESVLGVVPIGYGDGYPLALSNKASVRVHHPDGQRVFDCRVLGSINMDQITVDLTDAMGEDETSFLDAPVDVISDDPAAPNSVPALAALAKCHAYEILCRLSPNLPRRQINR